ncbi:MAG: rhodanese-like domain-containing protein [Bacteroidota bacterium]|nr:rhodanese-like domain-containing protein [Bacteroidota bacterium]MDP4250872.1 rhodanese-like domain-containing protein [Bacteroidota bacterium]
MIGLFTRLFSKTKADFTRLIREGSIIIDVCSAPEYKSGHIKGSENIPLDELNTKIGYLKKLNRPLITVCRSGSRSRMAKSVLTANGLVAYNGGSWYLFKRKYKIKS